MKDYEIYIRFTQPILGTGSADPHIHERFIASKAPDAKRIEEEVEAIGVDAVVERGTTVFPKDRDGNPFIWDYQIKGFMKEACQFCREMDGAVSKGIPAYRQKIDGLVFFPESRNVRLRMAEGEPIRINQRPLRAQTAQGPRVALAASEQVAARTECSFTVRLMASKFGTKSPVKSEDALCEWFAYGFYHGMGQWRNGGWGTFRCRITRKEDGKVIFSNLGE